MVVNETGEIAISAPSLRNKWPRSKMERPWTEGLIDSNRWITFAPFMAYAPPRWHPHFIHRAQIMGDGRLIFSIAYRRPLARHR
jgi:hypothetical protein